MRKLSMFVLTSVAIGLTACTTLPSSQAVMSGEEGSQLRMADFPSERRGAWIFRHADGRVSICSEPFSDTGLSTQQLMTLTAKLADKGELGWDNSTISTLTELKGRSPSVLALRDVMYRMCERRLSSPEGVIPPEEVALYREVIKVIGDFAVADRKEAEVKRAEAQEVEAKRAESVRGGSLDRARQMQRQGFDALARCKWELAEQSFAAAEAAVPGFQTSYEYARALRMGSDSKQKRRNAIDVDSAFMPGDLQRRLKDCPDA